MHVAYRSALATPTAWRPEQNKSCIVDSFSLARETFSRVGGFQVGSIRDPHEEMRKRMLLDSLSALSATRTINIPPHRIYNRRRTSKSRMTGVYMRDARTYTRSHERDVIWEAAGLAGRRVARESAITGDGANVRTMDRFDGCAREGAAPRTEQGWSERIGYISNIYLDPLALLSTLRNWSLADFDIPTPRRALCAFAKLSHH